MKLQFRPILLAFVLFYILIDPLQAWLLAEKPLMEVFAWLTNVRGFLIVTTSLFCFFLFSLGAYLSFLKLYTKGQKYQAFFALLVVAFSVIGLRYLIQEVIGSLFFGQGNYFEGTTVKYYIFDNLYYAIIYISLGVVMFFIEYGRHKEAREQALILEHQKSELTYLRSQFNPHFLFNILNNIYSLIYYKSDNALRSVEKLSSLLRYSLYEKEEKVVLKKEITHLHDFIELQRLRFDYDLALTLGIAENVTHYKVAPFLLIPFVENAFKHGNLKNPEQPLLIRLEQDPTHLVFKVENEKRAQQKDAVGGIGLENIQKRLGLIYDEKAILAIEETETEFKIKLKIALHAC